jgi:hypothetical protein
MKKLPKLHIQHEKKELVNFTKIYYIFSRAKTKKNFGGTT